MNETPLMDEIPTTFSAYLLDLGLAPSSAATYERHSEGLLAWLGEEGIELGEVTYRDLLAWVRTLEGSRKTKAIHLTAARHLFEWNVARKRLTKNPARAVQLRGVKRPLPSNLLSEDQLLALFRSYEVGDVQANPARQRNKAMLGVLVFQGLDAGELARLEVEDVDLEGGLLSVPGSRTSEGRVLYLEGGQVLGLHRYLLEGREKILEETGKGSGRLFVSAGSGEKLNNALALLMRELRGLHGWFQNARQIRASRIALWLKEHDLREAQYMAGHRYVSSTERYKAADLDALHRSLSRHHPLG